MKSYKQLINEITLRSNEEEYITEPQLDEVLDPSMGAGEYIKDFQKSDAPQFKGKSKEKRRKMGIAAYMAAKAEKSSTNEEVDTYYMWENIGRGG